MFKGRTINELAAELQRQRAAMRDFIAPATSLTVSLDDIAEATQDRKPTLQDVIRETAMHYTLKLRDGNGGQQFPIRPLAHQQVATWAGIPWKYYERMAAEAPALLTENVNTWLQRATDTKRMVRTLDGQVRAFLSNRYRRIDNFDVAEAVLPILSNGVGAQIASCEVTDNRLYIKALSPRREFTVQAGTHNPVNEPVQFGVVISNSEVGQGAFSVQTLLMVLKCTNGLIIPEMGMRRRHIGRNAADDLDEARELFSDETRKLDDAALMGKIKDVTRAAFDEARIEQAFRLSQDSTQRKIELPLQQTIEEVTKAHTLTDDDGKGILERLAQGGDLSQWGLAQAVTNLANTASDYEHATKLETVGGNILALAADEWAAKYGRKA